MEGDTTSLTLSATIGNVTMNSSMTSNQSTSSNPLQGYVLPTLPEWVSVVYLTLLYIAIGLGIPGNLITALAYFIIKNKTNCDWYIFFVALFDLVACVFRVSGYLMEFQGVWAKLTNDAYCIFVAWISQTSVCDSIFIFGLISVERYIKICCDTSLVITANQSRNICLIMTLVTFVMGFPSVFMYTNSARGICTVVTNKTRLTWVKVYYCFMFALFICLTVAVIFCYISIAWTQYSTEREEERVVQIRAVVEQSSDEGFMGSSSIPETLPQSSEPLDKIHSTKSSLSVPNVFIIPGPQTRVVMKNTSDNTVDPPTESPTSLKLEKKVTTIRSTDIKIFSRNQYARRQRRDFKITGLLFLVTTIFIVSWIPPYYALVQAFFIGYSFPMSKKEFIILTLTPNGYIINNFSNPLIYLALSAMYRQKVKLLFTRTYLFFKRHIPCQNTTST